MPGKRGDGIIRAKSILKDLQDPKGCHTREELLSKYDISIDSLNKDIRALRDSGIKIRYKAGKYCLENDSDSVFLFEKSIGGYAKKLPVLLAIQKIVNEKGKCTKNDIRNYLTGMGNTQQIAPEPPKQPEPPKEFQIYCSECGAVNPNGRTNCFNCGAKLHD